MIMDAKLKQYQRPPDWSSREGGGKPAVSVVIPAYNVRDNLKNTLSSLMQQTFPAAMFEVLVVDNGSDDGLLEMIKGVAVPFTLKYFFQGRAGRQVGKCRNIGIANATGDLVIFVDADCLCSSTLIERHVLRHRKRDALVVIGEIRMLDPDGCIDRNIRIDLKKLLMKRLPTQATFKGMLKVSLYDWLQRARRLWSAGMIYWMSGANSSARREYLLEAGGYDEEFDMHWGDEDAELGYRLERAGLKVVVAHEAMIFHQWHPSTKSGTPGYNRILLILKHPELAGFRMLMRRDNNFYKKTPEELKEMLRHTLER